MIVTDTMFNSAEGFGQITFELRDGVGRIGWPGVPQYIVIREGEEIAIETGQCAGNATVIMRTTLYRTR